ncbi:MAG TPA: YceI family protein [Longimicrobiaceae bacterium]|nr:YceI family protein [Longimicrobiaceae bacterium]
MKTRRTMLAAVLALGMGVLPAWRTGGAAAEYEIDQSHSQVLFRVKHMGISTVTGRFRDFSGTIVYDPQNLAASSARATIRTASIDTDNDRRDAHLRSADFFEAEKHPEISFTANRVRAASGESFKLDGTLTMRGVTRPITLDVERAGPVRGPDGRERMAFNATTRLDRTDYGLTWNRALEAGGVVVSNEVQIVLELAAIRKP